MRSFSLAADDILSLLDRLLHDLAGLHLLGDVGGVFDDLERLAVEIQDQIVAGLDPDLLAAFADALVLRGIVFATADFSQNSRYSTLWR